MPTAVEVGAHNDDKKAGAHSPLLTGRLSRAYNRRAPERAPYVAMRSVSNAAGGGAGRRHAEHAAGPDGSIARSAPLGAAAPLPEGRCRMAFRRSQPLAGRL